jgi:hypothetical protein
MDITPQEKREIAGIRPSLQRKYCILYWKIVPATPPCDQKVLRRINSNGIPVSTKKYSEVFMYANLQDALTHGKFLLSRDYDVKIMTCNPRGKDKFWLT